MYVWAATLCPFEAEPCSDGIRFVWAASGSGMFTEVATVTTATATIMCLVNLVTFNKNEHRLWNNMWLQLQWLQSAGCPGAEVACSRTWHVWCRPAGGTAACGALVLHLQSLKIHQRGVQWKQGVVIYMVLYTSWLYTTTPIHCTPLPLHPPMMNTQSHKSSRLGEWAWSLARPAKRQTELLKRCVGLNRRSGKRETW